MKISSITVAGFKSFGDRTSIEFAPGVTALIGPNGSGKSNLIDALKWATGGGRASSYRADDKRALIFHGASGKRSMGLAEVEVEFSTDHGSTKVARTLDRDGLSKLRLNGRPARFIDVEEALAGSGLGRAGVSVIGQGEVGQVLMADPEKLLGYVAEAAGVAKLSGRRSLAAARLDTAHQHLERLLDLVGELGLVVARLQREAGDANRYSALEREGLLLRFTIAGRRLLGLNQEIATQSAKRATLEDQLERGRGLLRSAEEAQVTARATLSRSEVLLREAVAETERRQGDLRIAEQRLRGLESRHQSIAQRFERIREEHTALEPGGQPEAPHGDAEAFARMEAEVATDLVAARAVLEARESELAAHEVRLEQLRRAVAGDAERSAMALARRTELGRQGSEIDAALAALAANAPVGDKRLAAKTKSHAAKIEDLRAAVVVATAVADESTASHNEAVAEATVLQRDVARLQASFEARRGYAQGGRLALTSRIDGVVGSVADLLEVPEHLREAVGASLGRRAENIVVENTDIAEAVLEHVRSKGGWVTVLPLDLLRSTRATRFDASKVAGVVGLASELVRAEPRFERVVGMLLGNVLVMEDFERAVALARAHRSRPRLVTLAGDLIEVSGAMSGGRPLRRGQVVGLAEDLRGAEEGAAAAEADRDRAAASRTEAGGALEAARKALDRAERRAAQLAETARTHEVERARYQQRHDDLTARQLSLDRALPPADEPVQEVGADPVELERLVIATAHVREAWTASSDAFRRAGEAHRATERGRLIFEGEQLAYREAALRHRSQLERAASLQALEQELGRELEQLETDRGAAATEVEAAGAALPSGLDQRQSERDAAERSLQASDRTLRRLTEEQAAVSQELEACRLQLARRGAALEAADEDLQAFPDGLEELNVGERAARSRLRDVTAEVEEIGPVNHRAADEYEQHRERLETLQKDMAEAEAAAAELEHVLAEIDGETTRRLNASSAQLDSLFRHHVQELFGEEAVGSIEVERDEGRPVGLRIHLQPPGKRTQALGLLSVGERTMGALAFLFALMADEDGEGLPMAVLDEVDAPLDEANIHKYCAFLERLAIRGTQFVLVTHQKATFEVADVLWGVTTEQGVSRVFSIRKEEGLEIE